MKEMDRVLQNNNLLLIGKESYFDEHMHYFKNVFYSVQIAEDEDSACKMVDSEMFNVVITTNVSDAFDTKFVSRITQKHKDILTVLLVEPCFDSNGFVVDMKMDFYSAHDKLNKMFKHCLYFKQNRKEDRVLKD